jgi:hypothetical protein
VYHFSGIVGVAIDSIHGGARALVGATVTVNGTSRQATTDSAGKFRIDSVPPGDHTLALDHPALDSVGLAVATQSITMPAGRYAVVRVATPSPATVVKLLCPPEKMAMGPSAVIGRVLDADTDAPDSGARVVVYWVQTDISTTLGVHRTKKVREAYSEANGLFRICGVPATVDGKLVASRNHIATAEVPVNPQGDVLAIALLHLGTLDTTQVVASATGSGAPPLLASTAPTSAQPPGASTSSKPPPTAPSAPGATRVATAAAPGLRTGHAVISGKVTDQKGNPLPGANISVEGAAATTTTNDDGTYTLRGLPNGTQALEVRKLTFSPVRLAVDLSNRAPRVADVKLSPAPPTLATVVVEGKMDKALRDVGFTQRKQSGLGHFLTAEQIALRGPIRMTDIFQQMPGIRVNYTVDPPTLIGTRDAQGGCITYVFDGVQTPMDDAGDFDTFMDPSQVAAVEVYSSSEAPPQFSKAGQSSCTVIVIWSKTRVGG